MLTGPPKIGNLTLPHAAYQTPVEAGVEDRSRYGKLRSGRLTLRGGKRFVRRYRLGFNALDGATFNALVSELKKPNFWFTPRTAAAGEDAAEEERLLVRCVSEIPEQKPLYRAFYRIDIELEATQYEDQSGELIDGGSSDGGGGGGGASSLDELSDVHLADHAQNDLLAYDLSEGLWLNRSPVEIGLALASHTHDDRYYTKGVADALFGAGLGAEGQTTQLLARDGSLLDSLTVPYAQDADKLDGRDSGHGAGEIPISDGTLNTNLNADLWDSMEFADYLNQPVRTGDDVTFAALGVTGASALEGLVTVHDDIYPALAYTSDLGSPTKPFRTAHIGELRVAMLTAAEEITTTWGRFLTGIGNELMKPLPTGTNTITVRHNNLSDQDVLFLEARGSFEFMRVQGSATLATVGEETAYEYGVTRDLDGTGANAWKRGDGILDTGTVGTGWIDQYAVNSMFDRALTAGPTVTGRVRTGSAYNAVAERWAAGNLKGLYNITTDTYGFAAGDPAGQNIVAAGDMLEMRKSDRWAVRLDNDGTVLIRSVLPQNTERVYSRLGVGGDAGPGSFNLGFTVGTGFVV